MPRPCTALSNVQTPHALMSDLNNIIHNFESKMGKAIAHVVLHWYWMVHHRQYQFENKRETFESAGRTNIFYYKLRQPSVVI